MLTYLHKTNGGCSAALISAHADHVAADFNISTTAVVSHALADQHDRLQDAGRVAGLIGEEDYSTLVPGYDRGCTVHGGKEGILFMQGLAVAYHLDRDAGGVGEELANVFLDPWRCHAFGISGTWKNVQT